ncbi:MAG TPA: tRNA (guanosine(37)-N1)-methyltransferase TrmD [Candidatus Portnoybacteria bacterium]|nr:tRNA (guanosine(37)-N1)-methyltransferase TrmD [Candidatus Portnoybacteria bacterium]
MLQFDILTIFPESIKPYFEIGILGSARIKKKIKINTHNLRNWTNDAHRSVDDRPFGGGAGMIFKIDPIYRAIQDIQIKKSSRKDNKSRIIVFSPKGKIFTQKDARRLTKYNQLILICPRYEGVDERVIKYIADEEISIGEYVLSGGEIPALVVAEAITRLIPGVLGKKESLAEESFNQKGVLEYPQYTRPEIFKTKTKRKLTVPKVLLSGHHQKIKEWREKHQRKM